MQMRLPTVALRPVIPHESRQNYDIIVHMSSLAGLLDRLAAAFGYQLRRIAVDPVVNGDEVFNRIARTCRPFTMTSRERMYALYQSVRYLVEANVAGDFVECGVWRGGSAMVMAHTLLAQGRRDRRLWLYDTFTGMTVPTARDRDFLGREAQRLLDADDDPRGRQSVRCIADLQEVRQNMSSTGYPHEQIEYVQGEVEATIQARAPESIALLRLDTDWHDSTRHELLHLYPRLVPRGVLIIDDYGHWEGCRLAVDEYFAESPILLSRIDYSGRLAVKPS